MRKAKAARARPLDAWAALDTGEWVHTEYKGHWLTFFTIIITIVSITTISLATIITMISITTVPLTPFQCPIWPCGVMRGGGGSCGSNESHKAS